MLETSRERMKLLKTGFSQKQIEEMYIECNELKILSLPILVDIVEVEAGQYQNTYGTAVGSAQTLGFAIANIFNASRYKSISSISSN